MKSKVLIVDDEHDVRTVMEACFSHNDFDVICAEDGLQALKKINEETFDAVITDIMMPNMNGLELASNIRNSQLNASVPIFIISGNSNNTALEKAQEFGVVSVIPKPFNILDFVKTVESKIKQKERYNTYDTKIMTAFAESVQHVIFQHLGVKPSIEAVSTLRGPVINSFMSAMIGIVGAQHRGLLSLSTGNKLLRDLAEAALKDFARPMPEGLAADFAGEIGNQIAEQVKINLLKLGIKIEIGLPQIVFGVGHKLAHRSGGAIVRIQFKHGDAPFALDYSLVSLNEK
jgi:CheY-like chemotaxis protein